MTSHLYKTTSIFFSLFCLIFFFNVSNVKGQIQINSDLYIGDDGVFFTGENELFFGLGFLSTSKTKFNHGIFSFPNNFVFNNASERGLLNGYGQTDNHTSMILPLGQSRIYAPIKLIKSDSGTVDAAYFWSSPEKIGLILDESIVNISSVEYWDIRGEGKINAVISLSWRPTSNIAKLTSSTLSTLTIVGWDGKKWVNVPSTIDKYSILDKYSDLEYGSISTNSEFDLSNFFAFTLGAFSKQLQVSEIKKVQLTAYTHKNMLFIESSDPLKKVIVHDMSGKLILEKTIDSGFKFDSPFNHADGIYIITIELQNVNGLIKKKLIKYSY